MMRSALAVVAGYILASSTQLVATLALDSMFGYDMHDPKLNPALSWILASVAIAFVCYFVASYITAFIARTELMRHATYLVAMVIVFNVVGLITQRGAQPFWFSLSMIVIPIVAVILGTRIRLAQAGEPANEQQSE